MKRVRVANTVLADFKNEAGNVESALVLIPLMILFLSVAQIGLSVYARNVTGELAQGQVAFTSIGVTSLEPNPQLSAPSPIALPLPGGGSVLVGQRAANNPSLTPLLPHGDAFTSWGIAVQE